MKPLEAARAPRASQTGASTADTRARIIADMLLLRKARLSFGSRSGIIGNLHLDLKMSAQPDGLETERTQLCSALLCLAPVGQDADEMLASPDSEDLFAVDGSTWTTGCIVRACRLTSPPIRREGPARRGWRASRQRRGSDLDTV